MVYPVLSARVREKNRQTITFQTEVFVIHSHSEAVQESVKEVAYDVTTSVIRLVSREVILLEGHQAPRPL